MYRLILVDDEPIVLKGIQSVFNLTEFGFILVKTYTNPLTALQELSETRPDLIITDVKMPQMDGLEFSAQAKRIMPNAQIVILSGHDNFSYAQAALRLGASDYLLKPIKKKDFEKMLHTAKHRLMDQSSHIAQKQQLEEAAKLNYSILRNRFFEKLLQTGTLDDSEMRVLYTQLGFCFEHSPFVLLKFVLWEMDVPADYMSLLERIIIELSQLLGQIALVEEFYSDEYLYLFVYDFKNVIFAEDELLAKVNSYIAKKAAEGIRLLYGISDMYKGVSNNILKAVTECDEIILTNGHSHSGNKSALDSLYTEHADVHLPNADIDALFSAISAGDNEWIKNTVLEIYHSPAITLYKDFGLSITLLILIKMCHMQNRYLQSQPGQAPSIMPEMININYLSGHLPNAAAMQSFILDKALELSGLVKNQEINAPSKIMLSAIRYIDAHYTENINLSHVAGQIYISKSYLCDLFKKEMNITFIDYVTNLRIEKAKYLLSHSDMKMYEISEAVGYNDYAYFSQIFKRHTGTTLSNYRKQH